MLCAAREVREAVRSRWFVLVSAGFFLLSFALSSLGLSGAERSGLAGFDRTTASLLNLALLFVPLTTLLLGGLSVAGDLEDGWLEVLLAQPVRRSEVFAGKYAGLCAAMGAAVILGFGGTGLIIGMTTGGSARVFLALVLLIVLLAATTLAVGVLLSVGFRSRARVVGAAFGAWLFFVYLCDLGTMGLVMARGLGPGQVFALAFLNPIEQARILGTLALSGGLDVLGPAGLFGLDLLGGTGLVAALAGGMLGTIALALSGGYLVFRKAIIS